MFLIDLVQIIFQAIYFIILAGVVLSWVRLGTRDASWLYHPAISFINNLSDQLTRPFRLLLDRIFYQMRIRMPLDFSPILAILAYSLLGQIITTILWRLIVRY